MSLGWRYAPSMKEDCGPEYWDLCQRCGGPRLPDGRCVVSGYRVGCDAGVNDNNRERLDWMRQPNENREAMERVREARREYREVMKEPQP